MAYLTGVVCSLDVWELPFKDGIVQHGVIFRLNIPDF